jgi:hypothetical protein
MNFFPFINNNFSMLESNLYTKPYFFLQKPYIFRHSDFYYSASDSTYQLACQPGFVFASDSLHAQKDVMIQSLKCDGKTHKYVDTLDSTNTLVSACVKVEGCKALRKPGRGMIHNQDQCNTEGKGIAKGCEVFVSCEAGTCYSWLTRKYSFKFPADSVILSYF